MHAAGHCAPKSTLALALVLLPSAVLLDRDVEVVPCSSPLPWSLLLAAAGVVLALALVLLPSAVLLDGDVEVAVETEAAEAEEAEHARASCRSGQAGAACAPPAAVASERSVRSIMLGFGGWWWRCEGQGGTEIIARPAQPPSHLHTCVMTWLQLSLGPPPATSFTPAPPPPSSTCAKNKQESVPAMIKA
jgi:hypothetical protein